MADDGGPGTARGVRADFWFGLGLVVLGLAVAVESWRMPRLTELNVHPMTAPGLVPGLLGVVIFVLGGILFLRAARAGGWRPGGGVGVDAADLATQARRFFVALAMCVGYAAGLVGAVPFWAATAAFVFLFITVFEWRRDRPPAGHLAALATAAVQAAVVSAAVTYVFETIFLVRLP
ncbi:MAG: tripartite tricarboxylate transporter TctB family protein [Hyphomicrobiales bacterium]|nr:tripartite tricarboxylate transporter TctB family protein [Hyphomicrobiales bacterium]MCP5373727.1 tripartite tricarboxylate transporter TctB family protein [Hyphomicrobiales bacterium]